jgi:hypothetical protein
MISQSFYDRHNTRCQTFGGIRFIQRDKGSNSLEAGPSQRRPDDL